MGTYDSRRGSPLSPSVPEPHIFDEENQVIDLLDQIDETGDTARDAVVKLVGSQSAELARLNNSVKLLEIVGLEREKRITELKDALRWALQPPHWPCTEQVLREHAHPGASDAFIAEAVESAGKGKA